ncbi:MAG TPA: hypothetical protein VFB62_12680 [Polyangiaceae bacterium]|nr:hypothetical protein [Polyangiaceae bacterium]
MNARPLEELASDMADELRRLPCRRSRNCIHCALIREHEEHVERAKASQALRAVADNPGERHDG